MSEEKAKDGKRQIEVRKIEERYYFAYGSNMNLGQMRFRCPDAEVVGNVRLEDYRLAFRGRAPGNGVATVLPEKGSCVLTGMSDLSGWNSGRMSGKRFTDKVGDGCSKTHQTGNEKSRKAI